MKKMLCIIVLSVCLICSSSVYSKASENPVSYSALFDEICHIVEENFYNPSLIQEKFHELKSQYGEKINMVSTQAEFSAAINAMLSHLNASPYLLCVPG